MNDPEMIEYALGYIKTLAEKGDYVSSDMAQVWLDYIIRIENENAEMKARLDALDFNPPPLKPLSSRTVEVELEFRGWAKPSPPDENDVIYWNDDIEEKSLYAQMRGDDL